MLRPKLLAHFAAASQPHSGDWLRAIPVGQIKNCLDSDSLSNAIAFKLGLQSFNSDLCHCSSMIDLDGLHP